MSGQKAMHRRVAKAVLRRGVFFINKHSMLQRYVLAATRKLGLYPMARAVYTRLVAGSYRSDTRSPYGFMPTDIKHLTPRARQIYADLKNAIEDRKKEGG